MGTLAHEDTKVTYTSELSVIHCGQCGGGYAIAARFRRECQLYGRSWTCPYCKTGWGYSKNNEIDRLKKQVESITRDRDWQKERRQSAEKEADHFRRSRDGVKGALAKVKKRIRHGVCPCCNRSFKDLASHMANKHPDFGSSDA